MNEVKEEITNYLRTVYPIGISEMQTKECSLSFCAGIVTTLKLLAKASEHEDEDAGVEAISKIEREALAVIKEIIEKRSSHE